MIVEIKKVEVEVEKCLLRRAEELLVQVNNNLRKSPRAASAFLAFVCYQKELWQKQQIEQAKEVTEKEFFAQTPFTKGFFSNLEKHNRVSLGKAAEVASFYGVSLKQAVAVGLGISQGGDPATVTKQIAGEGQGKQEKFPFGEPASNLGKNPVLAKAFVAFIDKQYAQAQAAKKSEPIREFCREIGLSYTTLASLRKGREAQGPLVIKAELIVRKLGFSLAEAIEQGLEILETTENLEK